MRVSKLHSIIGSVLICAFILSPFGLIANAFNLENLNTTDLTKSDLFANDFAGGGYAMLDCFGTSSNILDSIQGFFGDSGVGDKVAVDDKTQNLKEQCLDVAAQVNAQKTVASMSKSIFNWTQTGNGGNPLYVKDFGKYLSSIETQEVGVLKNKFTNEILNNPDKLPFAKDAVKTMQQADKSKDDIVSNLTYTGPDKKAFSNSFKGGGGWSSWLQATQNPANNPIGFNLKVSDELKKRQEEAKDLVKEELKQTSFLPVRECVDPNYKTDGTPLTDEDRKAGKTDICSKWDIKTPGSIVKDQASEAANSALNLALNADQKGKQLNVMFASLLTQLFNQGFATLGNRANRVMSNVQITSNVPTYGDNSGYSTEDDGTGDWFDSVWIGGITPRDIPTIIKNQRKIIEQLPERADIFRSIINNTKEVDFCVPGPNAVWTKDLGDYIGGYLKKSGVKVPEDFGKQVYDQLNPGNLATVGAAVGTAIVPVIGTAIGAAVGFVVGTILQAFSSPSREELQSMYTQYFLRDTNGYYAYIQKTYNNPALYTDEYKVTLENGTNIADNSSETMKLLEKMYEIKINTDKNYTNISRYQNEIIKNTQYLSLTKKQMARMQDICVQTHKLYVQAFNRQMRERKSWESWNRKDPTTTELIGYRKKKLVNGKYEVDPNSKLYSPEEARLSVTVFKASLPTDKSLDLLVSNISEQFDQVAFNNMYIPEYKQISEPKKVPPLPPFSEYALNCSGNIGSFGNPSTATMQTYNNNNNIKNTE